MRVSYQKLLEQHLKILKGLQYQSGLFGASSKDVSTGYDKSWLRDNFYECLPFEILGDWATVEKTYDAILNIFLKHESKIDWAIEHRPIAKHEYIHARFHPETFEEFWEEWGNKQNDSIGAILFRIGELEYHKHRSILNTEDKVRIVNKLIRYLETIEYWHDIDSGVWEENEEVHASSVGACLAGIKAVSKLPNINVPEYMIQKGEETLSQLLPRESISKFTDLALLSLIYPYNIVSRDMQNKIIEDIEYHFLKSRGVIRYKGDRYYNKNPDGVSEEAEWTFGLAWLAIIYEKMRKHKKAEELLKKLVRLDTPRGLPELYYSNSPEYNENTPLGWTEAMFIIAIHELHHKGINWKKLDI